MVGVPYILHLGDSLEFLRGRLATDSVKLQICSPPYNIGKEYEKRQTIEDYLAFLSPIIREMVRVCHPQGSVCWQVGNYVEGGEVVPLDFLFYGIFKECGLKLRNRIIWRFEHGLHAQRRFSGRYETLLWFTKGDGYTFHLDPVRVPSKYPGKRHFKGDNKGKPSCNQLGKNPGDTWFDLKGSWDSLVWEVPNVKANHVEKTVHPCQYPVELAERCVLALTDEGDRVYDPFSGVGTSVIAAIMHGREGIGSELCEKYHEVAQKRVVAFLEGTLRLRPLGKPVHTPTGKVSRVPEEWTDLGPGRIENADHQTLCLPRPDACAGPAGGDP